jgi:type II secretory ATPase GspE/PulE/Tfp pilus assembly ATPase PilB-like protein
MIMDNEKIFKKLILNAINLNTTDIHLQLSNREQRCEFRTLNGLVEMRTFKFDHSFFEYLKYIANLDLLTDLKPQSGRIKIKLNQFDCFIRCAYFKNYLIETIVLRILNPKNLLTLKTLFNEDSDYIEQKLDLPSGLILFSGSTGSGKTTSLFTCLKELKHKKIYSIEDPVEYFYDHLVQLEVNSNQSFNFKEAIKQVLRHDPNIIVIGEIRDEIEAKSAIRCALSGHLVLSTIHSNSAEMTIKRLIDMEIDLNTLKDVIKLIVYQELNVNEEKNARKAKFDFFEF